MSSFFIFLHVLASILLITVILMQSGRGGGLTEAFSSAESMFGAKTNEVMIRATTIVGVLFLVTSLVLAFLSARKEASLMSQLVPEQTIEIPINMAVPEPAASEPAAEQ